MTLLWGFIIAWVSLSVGFWFGCYWATRDRK